MSNGRQPELGSSLTVVFLVLTFGFAVLATVGTQSLASADVVDLHDNSASFVPDGPEPCSVTAYPGAPVSIPDNSAAGVNIPITVNGVGSINNLAFRFDGTAASSSPTSTTVGVRHSWLGDLIFKLTSPTGTSVTFMDRIGVPASTFGCSSNNLFQLTLNDDAALPVEDQCPGTTNMGPLTGIFRPNALFTAFDGQPANGVWTLNASDVQGADTGAVRYFSLLVNCANVTPSPTPTGTPAATFTSTATTTPTATFTATATGTPSPTATPSDPVYITVNTNPGGRSIIVDGVTYTAPQNFTWQRGSTHTVSTTSPETVGSTRYVWNSWSDGNAPTHQIVAAASGTLTANFVTQYLLTIDGGTPPTAYFDENSAVQISAFPCEFPNHNFWGWYGQGNGSYTGLSTVATVTMYGPIQETGICEGPGPPLPHGSVTVQTEPEGLVLIANGIPRVAPFFISGLPVGSLITLQAVSPQRDASGVTRYHWTNWSDGGAQTHTIQVPSKPGVVTASYTRHHQLQMNVYQGTAEPGSGFYPEGQSVFINSVPTIPNFEWFWWQGTGNGSYTGPYPGANVTMNGPIIQNGSWSMRTPTATATATATHTGTPSPTPTFPATPTWTPTATATASPPPTPCTNVLLTEPFQDIAALYSKGWSLQNRSQAAGATNWFQGNTSIFQSTEWPGWQSGYIAASYSNASYAGPISNWLITPVMPLQDGNRLTFWTRTISTPVFPDRLQVRMSTNGESIAVGPGPDGLGDFTALLSDINPTYTTTGYPTGWTEFTATVSGVPVPTTGRLAFRYFVENAGPYGPNADYIGIDSVRYTGCPVQSATTIDTQPSGRTLIIDGTTYTAPQTFNWEVGSDHTIGTASPQQAGAGERYVWQTWSDGGGQYHQITIGTTPSTYTAFFRPQYYLQISTFGVAFPTPGYFDAEAAVDISAFCTEWLGWLGAGNGSYTGPDRDARIVMHEPLVEEASCGGSSCTASAFSSTASILIPTSGPASLYPSRINVSGLSGVITKVTVDLVGLSHTFPDDLDMLLVGPGGQTLVVASDTGGTNDWAGANITIDDAAATLLSNSGANSPGPYRPTNYGAGDAFTGPAPAPPHNEPATAGAATLGSVFTGTDPNGPWHLYIVDDLSPNAGSISAGWRINITTDSCPAGTPTPQPTPRRDDVHFDYDGDDKMDFSSWDPADGRWYIVLSSTGGTGGVQSDPGTAFEPGDRMAPADYDGDGKTDVAIFKPSSGRWHIRRSSTDTVTMVLWGTTGDLPAPGDFDGDGKADVAIYRPSVGQWWILYSAGGTTNGYLFGQQGDIPLIGNFDNDNRDDIAVYRPDGQIPGAPDTAAWLWLRSSDQTFFGVGFGRPTDKMAPADYDGDGLTDIAVMRRTENEAGVPTWYILRSSSGYTPGGVYYEIWGVPTDLPVPGDYDGDGYADVAIRRGRETWVQQSTGGFIAWLNGPGPSGSVATARAFLLDE